MTTDHPGYLTEHGGDTHLLRRAAIHRAAVAAAFALLPLSIWCLRHRYGGLVGDAELYAVQALSRSEPGLAHDVFLSTGSQDRYTLFSPLYSFFIGFLGLRATAISLLVLLKICFYGSVFAFSRKLSDYRTALLTTTLIVMMPGEYGAYHVFHIAEDIFTARTLAETLAMVALCLHVHGRRALALGLAGSALFVHALMALPMVLLLLGLRLGHQARILWALAIVATALGVASSAALAFRPMPASFGLMDAGWLEMVRERSQFVFTQLWRPEDWEENARPFASLLLSAAVLPEPRVRTLCSTALMVGAAGLSVGLIASSVGPVALLLQGQAWRWVWILMLISMLTVAPTALRLWRAGGCGDVCSVLLISGWFFFSANGGVYSIAAALGLWLARRHIPESASRHCRLASVLLGLAALIWVGTGTRATLVSALPRGATEGQALGVAHAMLGADYIAVIFVFLVWIAVSRARTLLMPGIAALALGTLSAVAAPGALADPRIEGTDAQIEEFSDWRALIPPGANVFVVDRYYSPGFAWFTLRRPSYLTVDQSSGVIFSRTTAMEIRRRSEVLVPMEEPDWRLLSRRAAHSGRFDARALPLTRDRIVSICDDSELNFVIAKEDVGFSPRRHVHPGPWNGWNLYDCRRVNEDSR